MTPALVAPQRWLGRIVAVLSIAAVGVALWLAADPAAHECCHPGLPTGQDDGCAVCVFAQGWAGSLGAPAVLTAEGGRQGISAWQGTPVIAWAREHRWPTATAPPARWIG